MYRYYGSLVTHLKTKHELNENEVQNILKGVEIDYESDGSNDDDYYNNQINIISLPINTIELNNNSTIINTSIDTQPANTNFSMTVNFKSRDFYS